MGVMGEAARAQTFINANGATDTIFINYDAGTGDVRYKINSGAYIVFSWPCRITNTGAGTSTLKVLFENDLILISTSDYFICGSNDLQFGSASLRSDGTRPKITVNNVTDYPGLVLNGQNIVNGYSNISIFNLEVQAINGSTLTSPPFDAGGWIGQAYFGKGASGCYIVNCSSNGAMGSSSGGIVGRDAGSDGGFLTILGCYSSGSIDADAGGIAGFQAGINGEIFVQYSWSSGVIAGLQSGGIFGSAAGWNGTASANDCFSVGAIAGADSGGIFGKFAGTGSIGPATALRCYSRGNITGGGAGGIFGGAAGRTVADNCYSFGTVTGPFAAGIYGNGSGGGAIQANCYEANGNWNSAAANLNLTGTPPGGSVIGTTWADTAVNQPYDFSKFGYTPYSTNNISIAAGVPSLVQSFSQTVTVGSSSSAGVISGLNYTILQKSMGGVVGAFPTITINSTTGVISTTASTAPGTYTLTIDNEVPGDSSGYSITEVVLTVNPPPPVITSVTTASGTVGSAFTYTITASQSPTSYGASGLPAGLSINAATGVISGTPTVAAVSNVTISATNAGGTGSANLTLTVNPQPPVITSTTTASGTVGSAFRYTITASRSPTSYGASGLPAGLSINTATGVISGTPSAAGVSRVTISATNAGGTGSAVLNLTIQAKPQNNSGRPKRSW